jgi:adenylosuccinate synthase
MCERGYEYGSVTGRKRRCGWIDLVALRYAVMINGVTKLIMMKSDVLDVFPVIKACIAYRINGRVVSEFPFELNDNNNIQPVWKELTGWQTNMTKLKEEKELPTEFKNYMDFIENNLGVPISIVSVGPDREQTIVR